MIGKMPRHLAVWLNHQTARVLTLSHQGLSEKIIRNEDDGARGHVHHHSGTTGSGHAPVAKTFLENISQAIGEAQEILILGPVEARNALKHYLEQHALQQARRIIGVEAMDNVGLSEFAAFAQRFFERIDRITVAEN